MNPNTPIFAMTTALRDNKDELKLFHGCQTLFLCQQTCQKHANEAANDQNVSPVMVQTANLSRNCVSPTERNMHKRHLP